jgi:hypothetical protein
MYSYRVTSVVLSVFVVCYKTFHTTNHCVQTDPAKNVWTRAYLIPERNRTVRRQEEGKNSVYLFVFLHELGGNKCFINHFLLSDETFWLCHRILIEK